MCSDKCHPGHGCTNVMTKAVNQIDVEKQPDLSSMGKCTSPPLWVHVAGIRLDLGHKEVLESSRWLDDAIIAASQKLLKNQHPAVGSLQQPVLASNLAMEPQIGEFVQVLNLWENHWIVAYTIGCQASMYMTVST